MLSAATAILAIVRAVSSQAQPGLSPPVGPAAPAIVATPVASLFATNYGLGSWIWAQETHDKQTCRFWKAFEIPKSPAVVRARLCITADNEYRLFLDGREVGHGSDWHRLTEYDLTWLLSSGPHVLGVEGFNDQEQAGIILGMKIELEDGDIIKIASDKSWRVVPDTDHGWLQRTTARTEWPAATVVAGVGQAPWNIKPFSVITVSALRPVTPRFWQQGWFQITLLSICGIAVLICLRLMAQLTVQARAQRLLQLERARIARDIHDDLGAGLTQLVLLGEVAQSELPANSETRAQIDQLCERARNLSRTMDEIVWAINSRRDTLRDFATHVCKYAQAYLQTTPIKCRLDVEPELPPKPFDLPIRRNLFLAVKEALTNAAKHSEATELFLQIHQQGEGLLVVVVDNGKGFDLAFASQERNGLTNMSQRMKEVGGHFRISGTPGTGCRVEFSITRLHVPLSLRWLSRRDRGEIRRHAPDENPKAAPTASLANSNKPVRP